MIDYIIRATAEEFGVGRHDLMGQSRARSVARPRMIAMALARSMTNHSLPLIGRIFGGRDHTTVLHATRGVAIWREELPGCAEAMDRVERRARALAEVGAPEDAPFVVTPSWRDAYARRKAEQIRLLEEALRQCRALRKAKVTVLRAA